ncbi:hypothetical protein [Clostridium acetobutylicum]|uniref:hypothetical protein n=1 Tax=Clostridium acetobutylicum TaxID=1488 RepID=UPI0017EC17A6|nr:hypothetical protein [Clostridium acetobutylicum]NYC93834.1 uncharacterized protein YkwD [Clostridium acetobutylicum]
MKKIYSICVAVFILTSTFGGSVEAQKVFGEFNNKQCRESSAQLETSNLAAEESQVIKLVNSQRAKYGLAPLKANTQLINIARVKSRDMMMKKLFFSYIAYFWINFFAFNKVWLVLCCCRREYSIWI